MLGHMRLPARAPPSLGLALPLSHHGYQLVKHLDHSRCSTSWAHGSHPIFPRLEAGWRSPRSVSATHSTLALYNARRMPGAPIHHIKLPELSNSASAESTPSEPLHLLVALLLPFHLPAPCLVMSQLFISRTSAR